MRSTTLTFARGGRLNDLLAFKLGLDDLHERFTEVVLELCRVEVFGHEVNQREGHIELLLSDVYFGQALALLHAHLVRVVERFEHERAVVRAESAEALLVANRQLGDGGQALSSSARA